MAERNPVQLDDAAEQKGAIARLRPEDALYLHPRRIAALPQTERLASDLNILLKIAVGIGGIRDEDGLLWQLLGMIFDVVPAERAAILLLDSAGELSRSAGWDRVRGPETPVRVNRILLTRVVQERAGLLVSDVSGAEPAGGVVGRNDPRMNVLCVPM